MYINDDSLIINYILKILIDVLKKISFKELNYTGHLYFINNFIKFYFNNMPIYKIKLKFIIKLK